MNEDIVIKKEAIKPMIGSLETQIILQRHCSYDKQTGELLENSKEEQRNFTNCLKYENNKFCKLQLIKLLYFVFL